MSRILVVQTAFLGDVVLTTPLLRELRRVHPDGRLALLTTSSGRDALRAQDPALELRVLDKRWTPAGIASFARASRWIAGAGFDVAIAAQRSMRTGQLLRLSRAPLRVGFAGAPGSWAYTRHVPWVAADHATRRYLALARPAGGDPDRADPRPRLTVEDGARRRVAALLDERSAGSPARLLVLAPGSARPTKRWVPEGFARVAAAAAARGLVPVLAGAAADRAACAEVARLAGGATVDLAGSTGIPELAALLAGAAAVVANDSGAAHVAAAVGTPVVVVFGPTASRGGYLPLGDATRAVERDGLACRPCSTHGGRRCPRGHFRCMRELEPDQVLAALDELLGREPRRAQVALRPG